MDHSCYFCLVFVTLSCASVYGCLVVKEPKSRTHIFFVPERYTAGILNTDSLNSA